MYFSWLPPKAPYDGPTSAPESLKWGEKKVAMAAVSSTALQGQDKAERIEALALDTELKWALKKLRNQDA